MNEARPRHRAVAFFIPYWRNLRNRRAGRLSLWTVHTHDADWWPIDPTTLVFARESRDEPDLTWPPPPVESIDAETMNDVGEFFSARRSTLRRGFAAGLLAMSIAVGGVAAASNETYEIVAEPAAAEPVDTAAAR